jgi:hypothetical protein
VFVIEEEVYRWLRIHHLEMGIERAQSEIGLKSITQSMIVGLSEIKKPVSLLIKKMMTGLLREFAERDSSPRKCSLLLSLLLYGG